MKKLFNIATSFKTIRDTMIFYFGILIMLALFTFLMISLNYTQETVLDNSRDYTQQLVEQLNSEIDSYISYMENITHMVTGTEDSDVINYLFHDTKDSNVLKERVINQFQVVQETREDILNIAAVADNGKTLINDGKVELNPYVNLQEMPWYQDVIKADSHIVISSSHVQNAISNSYDWVVTLSCGLRNPKTNAVEGVFFIDLNYNSISTLCEKIRQGDKGYLFIVDKNENIIYHPKQKLLLAGLKTEYTNRVLEQQTGSFITEEGADSKLYTITTSSKTGWTIAGVSYVEELMRNKDQTQAAYVMTAIILLAFAMIFAIWMSRTVTKPLRNLKLAMGEVEKGRFENIAYEVEGRNEIASLGKSFNIMTGRIQQLMEANVQEQKEKRQSELKVLQAQINPHFLYNTLDSIIWMAEGGKSEEVVLMTSSLAKLLRQSISNEAEIVPIRSEIEYTRSYLTIQKMRYKDQLEFEIDVDEDILSQHIVKLVIQPLVENAIYHGIKYIEGKGMLRINGGIEDKQIVIRIRDNGIGMSKALIDKMLKDGYHKNEKDGRSNHVGIYNVNNRLQMYYGKEYGLTFESVEGIGTTVLITIPNQEVSHDEEI